MIYGVIAILTALLYGFLKSEKLYQDNWYKYGILLGYIGISALTIVTFSDDINGMIYLMTATLLYISVITDVHDKTLPIEYYLSIIPVLLVKILVIPESFFGKDLMFNTITIIVLVVIGYIFRASLGFGDIFLFITMTMLLGYGVTIVLILMALVLTSVLGLIMIAMRKANRRTQLPFTPFILFGYIVYLLI